MGRLLIKLGIHGRRHQVREHAILDHMIVEMGL